MAARSPAGARRGARAGDPAGALRPRPAPRSRGRGAGRGHGVLLPQRLPDHRTAPPGARRADRDRPGGVLPPRAAPAACAGRVPRRDDGRGARARLPCRQEPGRHSPVLLYVGNWVRAFGGSLGTVGITWSLAVEEQFYLVWPVVVLASPASGAPPARGRGAGLALRGHRQVRAVGRRRRPGPRLLRVGHPGARVAGRLRPRAGAAPRPATPPRPGALARRPARGAARLRGAAGRAGPVGGLPRPRPAGHRRDHLRGRDRQRAPVAVVARARARRPPLLRDVPVAHAARPRRLPGLRRRSPPRSRWSWRSPRPGG